MPGFGNNTQNAVGGAIAPNAQGTVRFSLSQATSSFMPIVITSGTAATQAVGTSANNVVQLNGSAQLPAVDGSNLTNLNAATNGFAIAMAIAL